MAPDLDQAIQQYATALQQLVSPVLPSQSVPESSPSTFTAESLPPPTFQPANSSSTEAQVLEVLIARDRVQAILALLTTSTDFPVPSKESLEKLSLLDKDLREQASAIVPFTQNEQWRSSFNPDQSAWWWFFTTEEPADSFSWLWSAISLISITASFSLIGNIVPRFLVGGPDLLSSFFVSLQSVAGLLSVGAVTKAIQETSQQVLGDRKLPKPWWGKLSAGLSFIVLLSVIGLRLSLPYWSERYTQWGYENYQAGDWSSAEADYQRALQLDPDNAQAHFRLGLLYEDMQEPDKARSQYQLAIQGGVPTAINNLARLNILTKKDYAAAVSLLLKAINDEKKQPLAATTKHAVLKNLGWARLKQKNYPDAEAKLLEAIDLESTTKFEPEAIADTHCLLAQVMEAQGGKTGALAEWRVCNQNANITIPEHDEWSTIAQQRLIPPETRK